MTMSLGAAEISAAPGRREMLITRLCRLDALDWLSLAMYVGLAVWAVIALAEPPLSLLGATGPAFTLTVTVVILVFAVSGAAGLVVDQTADVGGRRLDVELPASIGLIGAWSTYNVIVTLIASGHGADGQATIRTVFVVLTWLILIPLLVRFIVMVIDARRTFRAAKVAIDVGLVKEGAV